MGKAIIVGAVIVLVLLILAGVWILREAARRTPALADAKSAG